MACVTYYDHELESSATYDQVSGRWKATAYITWDDGNGSGTRQFHVLRISPELFSRFEDAERAGLEGAKNWVGSRATDFSYCLNPSRPARPRKVSTDGLLQNTNPLKLHELILHATSVGYRLRKTIVEGIKISIGVGS